MRELALLQYQEFERELQAGSDPVRDRDDSAHGRRPAGCTGLRDRSQDGRVIDRWSTQFAPEVRPRGWRRIRRWKTSTGSSRTSPTSCKRSRRRQRSGRRSWNCKESSAGPVLWTSVTEAVGGRHANVRRRSCCSRSSASARSTGASGSRKSTGNCSTAASRLITWYAMEELAKAATAQALVAECRMRSRIRTLRRGDRPAPTRARLRPRGQSSRFSHAAGRAGKTVRATRSSSGRGRPAQRRSRRRRNGTRAAGARLEQHLHAADHQPHRHALDRRADRHRREGLRPRPGHDRPRLQGRSRPP